MTVREITLVLPLSANFGHKVSHHPISGFRAVVNITDIKEYKCRDNTSEMESKQKNYINRAEALSLSKKNLSDHC